MHDAVADVLLERQALNRTSPFGIFASLLLHAALGAVIVVAARTQTARPFTPVVSVRLAAAPAAPGGARGAVRHPAPPRAAVRPPATIKPEAAVPQAEKTSATAKKPIEKSLFGKSTEKSGAGSKSAAAPPPGGVRSATQEPGGTSQFAVPGIGAAGVTGIEGGDFPYTIYIERMLTLIGNHWFRPQISGEALTRVYFVIDRDGRIRDPKVESASGNSVFDRAALRAVIEANPLPPLPFGYAGTYLGVHLTFH